MSISFSTSQHKLFGLKGNAQSPDVRALAEALYELTRELESALKEVRDEAHRARG